MTYIKMLIKTKYIPLTAKKLGCTLTAISFMAKVIPLKKSIRRKAISKKSPTKNTHFFMPWYFREAFESLIFSIRFKLLYAY